MGLKAFAITSDGVEYPNHKYLSKSQKKLAKLQRQLSRKTKGSNRWEIGLLNLANASQILPCWRSTRLCLFRNVASFRRLRLLNHSIEI